MYLCLQAYTRLYNCCVFTGLTLVYITVYTTVVCLQAYHSSIQLLCVYRPATRLYNCCVFTGLPVPLVCITVVCFQAYHSSIQLLCVYRPTTRLYNCCVFTGLPVPLVCITVVCFQAYHSSIQLLCVYRPTSATRLYNRCVFPGLSLVYTTVVCLQVSSIQLLCVYRPTSATRLYNHCMFPGLPVPLVCITVVCFQAYHSSAYNHGKHPYKGSATDIPSPPGLHPSDLPQGKPPVAPRFKTELQLSAGSVGGANVSTASENATWGADSAVPCCQVTGGSSAALPKDAIFRHMGNVQYLPTDGATRHNICVSSAPPLVPVRTCSKNITLANLQGASHPRGGSTSSDGSVKSSHAVMCPRSHGDMRSASHENLPRHYGSHERLLRTSNENICVGGRTGSRPSHLSHSSDDLLSRVSMGSTAAAVLAQRKARTIGPVNCGQSMANRNAVPYTRSHTTLSLVTAPTSTSAGMVAARDAYNHNLQGAPWCRSNYYYTPRAVSGTEPRMPLTSNGGYYSCRDTEQMCWSGSEAPSATYGIAVSFPISTDNACNVAELPKSYSTDFEAGHSQHAHEGSASRYSMPATNDRNQAINLVTERMKKFESMDSVDSNSSVGSATSGNGRYHSDAPKLPSRRFGCDSVATRAAQYEHLMSDDDEYMQREQSPVARQQLSGSLSYLQQNPSDTNRSGNVAPATINIYFRSESPQHPIMQLDRSPHRPRAASHSPHPANRRSPRLQLQIQRPTSESSHRFAMRQPSYLSAIRSPKGGCLCNYTYVGSKPASSII